MRCRQMELLVATVSLSLCLVVDQILLVVVW